MRELEDLSIVVAYRYCDPHRGRIFDWTMDRYHAIAPDAEIVVGSMTSGDEWFCLSEARNEGVARTTRPYLLIADADAVAYRPAIVDGLQLLRAGAPWAIGYDDYYHLDQATTEQVLASDAASNLRTVCLKITASYPGSNSGLVMISRENFEKAGWFDERHKGWSSEDQCWALAADTLLGPAQRVLSADLLHLWHPVAPGSTTDNPNYPESAALWDRYKAAAGDSDAMRQLVGEWQQ